MHLCVNAKNEFLCRINLFVFLIFRFRKPRRRFNKKAHLAKNLDSNIIKSDKTEQSVKCSIDNSNSKSISGIGKLSLAEKSSKKLEEIWFDDVSPILIASSMQEQPKTKTSMVKETSFVG